MVFLTNLAEPRESGGLIRGDDTFDDYLTTLHCIKETYSKVEIKNTFYEDGTLIPNTVGIYVPKDELEAINNMSTEEYLKI